MKIIGVGILVVLLLGCDLLGIVRVKGDDYNDTLNLKKIQKADVLYSDEWNGLRTVDDIVEWIYTNITYTKEEEDYWQTPQETMNIRRGDCDDMCILFMNILYTIDGTKSKFLCTYLGYGWSRTKVTGGYYNHAEVWVDRDRGGADPTNNRGGYYLLKSSIKYEYSFDLFFN